MTFNYISWLILIVGLLFAIFQVCYLNGKVITHGTVDDISKTVSGKTWRNKTGHTVYSAKISFLDVRERPQAFTASWLVYRDTYAVGDKVKIFYDINNPNTCGQCSFDVLFSVPFILILTGTLFLLLRFIWPWLGLAFDAYYK